jgi:hypothetical protein
MHMVSVLLVGGPSSCACYQVDFLCLLEQGTVELIFIHNLAFISGTADCTTCVLLLCDLELLLWLDCLGHNCILGL